MMSICTLKKQKAILALLLLRKIKQRKKSTKLRRRFWVHPINKKRKTFGEFHHLYHDLRLDDDRFFKYTRMTVHQFDVLLDKISPLIQKSATHRTPISPAERLFVTLRHLSTGTDQSALADTFRLGISTWQLPHCLGAIDGKHCAIRCPGKSGSMYFNFKKFFSIVLFAVADADYFFTYIDVGSVGSESDASIFASSKFGKQLKEGKLKIPCSKPLPGSEMTFYHYFVGDEAFPLLPNLMHPYAGRCSGVLPFEKRIFNYRLSRARRIVENTFGIAVTRWRILRKPIESYAKTATSIIKAVCVLHNYVKMSETKNSVRNDLEITYPNEIWNLKKLHCMVDF